MKELLKISEVKKSLKGKEVLKGVTFTVNEGDIVAIMGPNGVGKTTLFRTISGLYEPAAGMIEKKGSCSVLFEYNGLYPQFSLRENLMFFQNINSDYKTPLTEQALDIIKSLKLEHEIDKRLGTYSKGMLRKVAVARAVLQNPNMLILDEPFDGLDVESHAFLIEYLKNWVAVGDRAILVSSHNMSDIERLSNRVVFLKDGVVSQSTTLEQLHRAAYKGYFIRFDSDQSEIDIIDSIQKLGIKYKQTKHLEFVLDIEEKKAGDVMSELCFDGRKIVEFSPVCENLEDIYLKRYSSI